MRTTTIGWALGALVLALPAAGAPAGVVEAVQYPAWVERDGKREPLAPGMEVEARDTFSTGDGGRVRMRLAEGSAVKVGQKARFTIEKAEPAGVFRATLVAAAGAFRFTTDTDPMRKAAKRDIEIRALNVSAGVRGTDLWGRSTPERSFIVLIEGRIETRSAGHPGVTLDTPLAYYERRGEAAPRVLRMDAATLEGYARETEMQAGGPVATAGGQWSVVAASLSDRAEAAKLVETLRSGGYPARVLAGEPGPSEVVITGLAGEAEARSLADALRSVKGVPNPAVRSAR